MPARAWTPASTARAGTSAAGSRAMPTPAGRVRTCAWKGTPRGAGPQVQPDPRAHRLSEPRRRAHRPAVGAGRGRVSQDVPDGRPGSQRPGRIPSAAHRAPGAQRAGGSAHRRDPRARRPGRGHPLATDSVAALLDVDPMAIQVHLLNHSLFGLTRDSRAAQDRKLGELRDEGPIAGRASKPRPVGGRRVFRSVVHNLADRALKCRWSLIGFSYGDHDERAPRHRIRGARVRAFFACHSRSCRSRAAGGGVRVGRPAPGFVGA